MRRLSNRATNWLCWLAIVVFLVLFWAQVFIAVVAA